MPELQEVNSDLQIRTPRLNLEVDREKAAALGLDFQQIESALYNAYGPTWASTIYAPQNQYRVMLEVEDQYQAYGDMLHRLYLKPPGRSADPAEQSSRTSSRMPVRRASLTRASSLRDNQLQLKPGVALGEAVDAVQDLAA